jgi:hypothetical protein
VKRTQWLVAVPVLFAAAAFAKEKDPAAAEAKLKPEAAKLVLEYAAWCSSNGAKKAGAASLEEAASLDPQAPKLAETKGALEALADDAADADAVAKQRKAAGPKIASAYDKLAALDHDAKDDGRFEDYLFKALAWEPSAARIAKVRRAVDDAAGRPDQAGRLLVKLKRADADGAAAGRYDKLETDMALKDVVLLGSESHALVGYVSLPRDWAKGKTYPVVVGVEGAGCNFLGYCRGLMNARGSRSAIVVAPVTLSNTNPQTRTLATYPCYTQAILDEWGPKALGFDGPGVDALLAVVTKRFGGEEKVFLTGFSRTLHLLQAAAGPVARPRRGAVLRQLRRRRRRGGTRRGPGRRSARAPLHRREGPVSRASRCRAGHRGADGQRPGGAQTARLQARGPHDGEGRGPRRSARDGVEVRRSGAGREVRTSSDLGLKSDDQVLGET